MRLPRRRPRQVYRLFDEEEFLTDEHRWQDREPPAEQPHRDGEADASLARPRRSPGRHLGPALLALALAAAVAIAINAISPFRRDRHRPSAAARAGEPRRGEGAASSGAVGVSHRKAVRPHSRPRRPEQATARPASGRRPVAVTPLASPTALAPSANAGRDGERPSDEFSFERRLGR